MADKFALICNGGLYHFDDGKNMATMAQWKEELVKWNGGSELFETGEAEEEEEEDEEGEEPVSINLEELVRRMLHEGSVQVYSSAMAEMGDDYVELELVKLAE